MKKIVSITIILVCMLMVNVPMSAQEDLDFEPNSINEIEDNIFVAADEVGENVAIDRQGNFLQFKTKEERDIFVKAQQPSRNRFYGYTVTNKHIGTKYYSRVFIGYNPNTPSWSKASSYSLTTSRSASVGAGLSYNGIGFNVSGSVSAGATINIPASPNRWSKLGYLGDVVAYQHEVKVYYNGVLQSISYPVSGRIYATYNFVVYG